MASVLSEYLKTTERTVFWDETLLKNVDPFESLETGFWASNWGFKVRLFGDIFFLASLLTLRLPSIKLKILRQLVELQLTHSAEIKGTIDHAWGIQHNKHKKTQTQLPSLDSSDPKSKDNLVFLPIGQDSSRKRYWAADGPCAFLLGCFHFPIYGYLPGNCYMLDILLPR